MREFMHGNEWWGLRDDGTWVRWNNQSLEWDPQAAPPPSAEMREVTKKPSPDVGAEQPGSGSDSTIAPSLSTAEGIDPVSGLPLPPGSKVYRWEFKKELGTPPDRMPPGAKTFRWQFGKKFGPLPLEDGPADPNASPEELRRTAFQMVRRRILGVDLWFGLILVLLFIGGVLFLLWLIDLGFNIG